MEVAILKKFREALVQFLQDIYTILPEDEEVLTALTVIRIGEIPIEGVMLSFVKNFRPSDPTEDRDLIRKQIASRNEAFFLSSEQAFSQVKNNDIVAKFKALWVQNGSPLRTDDNKASIWRYIDLFVALADRYEQHVLTPAEP